MIEAKASVFAVERKIDRLDSEYWKKLDVVDVCHALTEAQSYLVKERARNVEKDKEAHYELRQLIVRGEKIKFSRSSEKSTFKLPKSIYRDLGIEIMAVKRDCGKKLITLTKMETGDLLKSRGNPYWRSSYAWEQAFGVVENDQIVVFNGTDFKVEYILIDYIAKPQEIHCPSKKKDGKYVDWNGKVHETDRGWILDDLHEEGVNLAVQMLTSDVGDTRDFQLKVSNTAQTEQTSKF